MTTDLGWLLQRGSPLPISNREVKPACADGTANQWESMTPPFFYKILNMFMLGIFFWNELCYTWSEEFFTKNFI